MDYSSLEFKSEPDSILIHLANMLMKLTIILNLSGLMYLNFRQMML